MATLSFWFFAVLTWCASHPAEVTLALGALSSFFYDKLSKYPRWQAFFSLLSHMGFNLPGVGKALNTLIKGAAKNAPKVGVVLALVGLGFAVQSCGAMSAQDKTEVGKYEAQQDACILANPHDKSAIDACRAQVKADWCAKWGARFDAGVCQ